MVMSSNALKFGNLGFRNFLSYGPKEVVLALFGNFITCILGENLDDGGEDSRNGVGKSAIIDALCYVLFGKVIRGISNQKLINKMSENGQMTVWVEFEKGEWAYRVERSERPGRLLLLRKPVDSTEDFHTKVKRKLKFDIARGKTETTEQIIEILGFDIILFEYLVANSSESTEFFKLSEDKQRLVIEPLFGFTIMSIKAKILKEERKEKNKELAHAESTAEATKQANLRITQQIDDLKHRSTAWESRKDDAVTELTEAVSLLESVDADQEIAVLKEIEELDSTMREVNARLRELDAEQRERTSTMNAHGRDAERAVADMEKAEETIASLDHSECPTCKQHWEPDPEFRKEALTLKETAENTGAGALASFEEMQKDIEVHAEKLDDIRKPLPIVEQRLADLQQTELTYQSVEEAASAGTELDNIRKQLVSTSAETNPHSESIEGLQTDAIKVVDETEIHELRRLIRHYTYMIELLTKRDSFLRQLIIDRWLPHLNRRMAHWLDILELPHQVRFNPDLTATITNYSQEFDYGNLSKGQRLRVRVALNLSFQDVFEFMNYPINMLAVDELLDSGMCASGASNSVNALKEIGRKKDKRIFLITHRDDIAAKVDDIMNVFLENNQSRIEYEQVV
jgi:DNA repair exonuclease SbcCD ATPase subunit